MAAHSGYRHTVQKRARILTRGELKHVLNIATLTRDPERNQLLIALTHALGLPNRAVVLRPESACRLRHQGEAPDLEGGEAARVLFRSFLLFDVLLDNGERRSTARGHEVTPAPKHRLAVRPRQFFSKVPAQQAAGHRLPVVRDHRGRRSWIQFNEKVDVIGFAVHLQERAIPVSRQALDGRFEVIEHRCRQAPSPVFRHEDEMVTKCVSAVKQAVNLDSIHGLSIIG